MSKTTDAILDLFEMVSAVPRPSGKEERIRARLIDWAEVRGLETRTDPAGNLVVVVPASPGHESAAGIVFQGHMDMVCEKRPSSSHNFETDGIRTRVDGEWLAAQDTTLGADNGIAIAIALAIADDRSIPHPGLELLFTVDEESGLTGALKISPDLLSGRILINLDSEDEGVFTVGCAGGVNLVLTHGFQRVAPAVGARGYRLSVAGLSGGHSGTDIAIGRANANLLLARLLTLFSDSSGFQLVSIGGGNAHNAIPRDASAQFALPPSEANTLSGRFSALVETVQREYRQTDPGLEVILEPYDLNVERAMPHETSLRLVQLVGSLPDGPASMSATMPDLVETSGNVAVVRTEADSMSVLLSLRGSVASRLEELVTRVTGTALGFGAQSRQEAGYPGWEPDLDSPLLQRAKRVFRARFGADPIVEVVHAGLECGVIAARYPGMQMLSVGPTIVNPHSPDERLHIGSIERVYWFLCDLLADFAGTAAS